MQHRGRTTNGSRPGARVPTGNGPGAPRDERLDEAAGTTALVFSARVRWGTTGGAAIVGGVIVAASSAAGDDTESYAMAHAVGTVPLLALAVAFTWQVLAACPPEYRAFWQRWLGACVLGTLASIAAIAAFVFQVRAFLALDMALILASAPFWVSASLLMVRAMAGRRRISVDVIDATMAVVVLGAPGILVFAEPLRHTPEPQFAVPFALTTLLAPAAVYISLLNLTLAPRGERATLGIGVVLGAAFAVNITLQLAYVLGDLPLPVPVFVGAHVVNMGLTMAVPLWAHRRPVGGLDRLPPDRQVRRRNPMPSISAVVLSVIAIYVFLNRHDSPWSVNFLTVTLVMVVVLNAARYAVLNHENQRLYGELSHRAEDRRRLLASMVRALDDDRQRTVAELHTQAVGSLTTLGTLAQTAYATLPSDTAQALKETIAQLQGDLTDRAEKLRQLMVALRPPSFDEAALAGAPDDGALATALRAHTSELFDQPRGPEVRVQVDPALELDRSTMTIVYRIVQEALMNAARHARARNVTATVGMADGEGTVTVEVRDDGVGFVPDRVVGGSGMATMQLFTNLGRGELTVLSAPGAGTLVRGLLGVRRDDRSTPAPLARRGHLHLVGEPEVGSGAPGG